MSDNKVSSFLVIEPHSDDAVFGMGGTIFKLVKNGWQGNLLLITSSDLNFEHLDGKKVKRVERIQEHVDFCKMTSLIDVNEVLKMVPIDKETELDTCSQKELIKMIERAVDYCKPDVVYVPGMSIHQDHRAVWNAAMTALRPTRNSFVKTIFVYELPTYSFGYAFEAQCTEDISETIADKVNAMKIYRSQFRGEESQLSIKRITDWATIRGFQANCKYAESFEIVRMIK